MHQILYKQTQHSAALNFIVMFTTGSYSFIQQHIMMETDPRTILRELLPDTVLPPDLDDMTLWQIIINISEPPKRKKRKDINTLDDVVRLLQESKKILVLTGAGVSSWFEVGEKPPFPLCKTSVIMNSNINMCVVCACFFFYRYLFLVVFLISDLEMVYTPDLQ